MICRCSLPVYRNSLKNGSPVTYFGPALDPHLGGSGRKTTKIVRDHEYFIPTKFHQDLSSGSGEEVENVKSLQTDDGRTDGRRTVRYDNSSLEPSAQVSKKRGMDTYCSYLPVTSKIISINIHVLYILFNYSGLPTFQLLSICQHKLDPS